MAKNIYFIRHGESEENQFRILGDGTSPLSVKGQAEAELIARRAQALGGDKLFTSPFLRAHQTALAISRLSGLAIEISDTLIERKAPLSTQGRSMDEAEVWAAFKTIHTNYTDPDFRYEDAESFTDLKNRAQKALELIIQSEGKNIIVVTHGLFLRVLIGEMLFGNSFTGTELINLIHGLRTTNTGLTWCQYDEDFVHKPWRIMTWNDHNHLGETAE